MTVCMSVHYVCAVPVKARRGNQKSRTGIVDAQVSCWALNLGPLCKSSQYSQLLLTISPIFLFQILIFLNKGTRPYGARL